MPVEVKADSFPLNARVSIDYTKPKGDRITFSYPNKTNNRFKWVFGSIYPVIIKIWFFFLVISSMIGGGIYFMRTGIDSAVAGSLVVDWASIWLQVKIVAILFGFMLGPPLAVSLYLAKNYDKYSKIFPKLNFWVSSILGDMTRCVVTKLDGLTYEIPHFDNVYMNYEATGEFGKYLEKVDVIEHPFKFISKKRGVEKEEPNDSLWKSVFKFSQIPTTGKLEVNFI